MHSSLTKFFFFLSLCFFSRGIAHESQDHALVCCLCKDWGVDENTSFYIQNKFHSFLDLRNYDQIVDQFVEKSKQLKIDFSPYKILSLLHPEDGTITIPKEHIGVFESPYIRILWGSTLPAGRTRTFSCTCMEKRDGDPSTHHL